MYSLFSMKIKLEKNFAYSLGISLLGVIFMESTIGITEGNYDKYHWLILAPVVFPLAALVFLIISIHRSHRYWKMLPILFILVNLALGGIIFLAYAFSYWQF